MIVNWNGKQLLQRCLETLKITDYACSEVVVVDNGSTDSSVEMIKNKFASIHTIANAKNLGYPRAVNQGILYALEHQADYVLVMNNDMEFVHRDWLSKLLELAEVNTTFGIIGPKLLSKDGKSTATAWLFRRPFTYVAITPDQSDRVLEADYVQGSALLIRREVIERIGFFDEAYYPTLIDDIDYCVRAKKAGFKVVQYTGASLIHLGSVSLSKVGYFAYLRMLYTNLMRFRLLYYRGVDIVPSLMEMILMCLFRRVDNRKPLGTRNLAFQTLPGAHFYYFARAAMVNLRHLRSIVWRRVNDSFYVPASGPSVRASDAGSTEDPPAASAQTTGKTHAQMHGETGRRDAIHSEISPEPLRSGISWKSSVVLDQRLSVAY